MYLAECTGKGVRVAVIDSGVHAAHPHVAGVHGGFGVDEHGQIVDDFVDRLGHGTAVAAAIREKAPDAELLAIKVFWRALATDVATLTRAIDEASIQGAHVINLSLGTAEMAHRSRLESAVERARRAGALVVAARHDNGTEFLPGCLDGAIGVEADDSCDRGTYTVSVSNGQTILRTSPYPRDIPGVPRERNVHGISFAVANASGFVARALGAARGSDVGAMLAVLQEASCAPS